jgi:hypothetical protein
MHVLLFFVARSRSLLSDRGVGLGRLDTGIVGSNSAQGIDVCPRLSVLFSLVEVEALRRVIPGSGSPTKCRHGFTISEIIRMWNRSKGLIRKTDDDDKIYKN